MFDRSLGACVAGVEARESRQQRRDNGDQLATFTDVSCACLKDKEGSFGVDTAVEYQSLNSVTQVPKR